MISHSFSQDSTSDELKNFTATSVDLNIVIFKAEKGFRDFVLFLQMNLPIRTCGGKIVNLFFLALKFKLDFLCAIVDSPLILIGVRSKN